MESFDQSLKYLLQRAPADFIGFGLRDPTVRVLAPLPSALPARGRDIDGAYLIARGARADEAAEMRVAHVELHRRHQGLEELAVDVAEAQIRLFRRERRLVVSHVWDLYGDAEAPVLEERALVFGEAGSRSVYVRINLRGLGAGELLAHGAPTLWPLVALTRDGAVAETIVKTREAIDAHAAWTPSDRANHLALLWFVAEAEGVPGTLIQDLLSEERLMESELYNRIFGRGEAKGLVAGEAKSILAVLSARGIPVSDTIRERILGCTDIATLDVWIQRAAVASTAAAVVRAKAPARPSARRRSRP